MARARPDAAPRDRRKDRCAPSGSTSRPARRARDPSCRAASRYGPRAEDPAAPSCRRRAPHRRDTGWTRSCRRRPAAVPPNTAAWRRAARPGKEKSLCQVPPKVEIFFSEASFKHGDDVGMRSDALHVRNPQYGAELARHGELIVQRQVLVADEQDGMFGKGVLDRGDLAGIGSAEIDAADLGAEIGGGRGDLHGVLSLAGTSLRAIMGENTATSTPSVDPGPGFEPGLSQSKCEVLPSDDPGVVGKEEPPPDGGGSFRETRKRLGSRGAAGAGPAADFAVDALGQVRRDRGERQAGLPDCRSGPGGRASI